MKSLPRRTLAYGGLLALSWAASRAQAQTFVGRAEFGTGATIPMAWSDFNGDGFLDVAVGNYGGGNQLFLNDGTGVFAGQSQFGSFATFAVVWADVDEDGDSDLAVGNGLNMPNYLYINNGDGTFTQQAQFGLDRTCALAWADCDDDGDLDLAVGNGILNVPGQNRLYRNNGDGTFTGEDQFGNGETASVAWGDYDRDGDPDLAVGNGGFHAPAQNYLYTNNGNGTFAQQAQFGMGDSTSVVWGDADNDGDLDLAVGNWGDGQDVLYVNNGDGTFVERRAFGSRDANTIAWGDYDNDGDLDLAVGNGDFVSADQNYLYVNDGSANFTEVAAFGLGSTDSVTWADVDGDGDLDLAVGNEHSPAQNYLYENRSSAGSWIAIELRGLHGSRGTGWSNASAIGAKVSVFVAGHAGEREHLLGYREIAAHGGFSSQNGHGAWFGVGAETSVDVVVQWPGSHDRSLTQVYASIPTGRSIRLVEGAPWLAPPVPGVAGQVNTLRSSGVAPGTRVYFAWSLSTGSTPVPGCPNLRVELRQAKLIGSALTDERGEARLQTQVPGLASGRQVHLQAVERETCSTSNGVEHEFP